MKKTRLILVALIALIALSSCNLDNSGILTDVINSIPSDNRNRHFIAFDETDGVFYYTRVDGFYMFDADDSRREVLLSNNEVFTQNAQDKGWLYPSSTDSTQIIYVNDYVEGEDVVQTYYLLEITNGTMSEPQELTLKIEGSALPSTVLVHEVIQNAATETGPVLLMKNQSSSDDVAYLASASLNSGDMSITLSGYGSNPSIDGYKEIRNGLIWYDNYKFQFLGKEVIFCNSEGNPISDLAGELGDNPIQAVAIDSDANRMVAVSYNDGLRFYAGEIPTDTTQIELKYIATVEKAYNRPFECIIMVNKGDQVIKWLNYSAGSTSEMYTLDLDNDHDSSSFDTSTGLEADAFAYYNDKLYMLTRNKGFFEISDSDIQQL